MTVWTPTDPDRDAPSPVLVLALALVIVASLAALCLMPHHRPAPRGQTTERTTP